MAWQSLASAAMETPDGAGAAMSLVTLSLVGGVCDHELAFYAEAERSALAKWHSNGLILLAFCTLELNEMVIVCPCTKEVIMPEAAMLPYVTAELATYDVRAVAPIRFIHSGPRMIAH
jgi:hypothetical protein